MEDRALEEFDGWRNHGGRVAMLIVGWIVLIIGLGSAIFGLAAGGLGLSLTGLMASLVAWAIAHSLPDPTPSARRDVVKRREIIARIDGHHLPA